MIAKREFAAPALLRSEVHIELWQPGRGPLYRHPSADRPDLVSAIDAYRETFKPVNRPAALRRIATEFLSRLSEMEMALEELIAWYRAEADRLKKQIELMESGRMRRHSREADGPFVDTTDQELESCKSRLAQLDALVERHEPKSDEGIRPEDLNSENDG
jgi:hypothetical protein